MVPTPHDPRHPAIIRHLRTLAAGAAPAPVRIYEDSHLAVITHPKRYYSVSYVPMVGGESYFVLAVDKRCARYPEMWETRGDEVVIVDAAAGRSLADLVYAYIAANPA